MNRVLANSIRFALCPVVLAVGLSSAALAQAQPDNHGSEQMNKAMMSGMQQM